MGLGISPLSRKRSVVRPYSAVIADDSSARV